MAGANIRFVELDDAQVRAALGRVLDAVENPAPLFEQITSYLKRVHKARFAAQQEPDGTPWQPLSPQYQQRKHRNADKILTLRGYLNDTLRGQWRGGEYLFGTNLPYGAVHQFGARQGQFGKSRRGGPLPWGNIPARPWLGTSTADDERIVEMTQEYLEFAVRS